MRLSQSALATIKSKPFLYDIWAKWLFYSFSSSLEQVRFPFAIAVSLIKQGYNCDISDVITTYSSNPVNFCVQPATSRVQITASRASRRLCYRTRHEISGYQRLFKIATPGTGAMGYVNSCISINGANMLLTASGAFYPQH